MMTASAADTRLPAGRTCGKRHFQRILAGSRFHAKMCIRDRGSSWQMELYRRDNGLSLSGGLADAEFGAWSKTLAPGESFTAPKAVLTAVRGGVDQASRALAENTRRAIEAILPDCERELPVIFNEFCSTWGCPTEESVLRQVRSLAGRGIGYYVIDAGWYDDRPFDYGCRLGSWQVSKKSFPRGLGPVVDAIHQAGMKAGIWFEFEMAGRDEPDCFQRTDWLLHRHGIPITVGDRRFWDLRKPEVQDYLARHVIDFLRDNRLDYLKVDYNDCLLYTSFVVIIVPDCRPKKQALFLDQRG